MNPLVELFGEHPGWFFVAATLVPLASFVLILLASAMWCATRPFRDSPAGAALFNLFGGEERGRIPAYVATGAIALAFVLSLTGFIWYTRQQSEFESEIRLAPGSCPGNGGGDQNGRRGARPRAA